MAATAALGVLTLAALLVRAQTLSNGVDGYYATNNRFAKLDKFLQDRMGLGGNRSQSPVLTTDRGLLMRSTTASTALPEDDDEGGDDNDNDDDDKEDDELKPKVVRLRHRNRLDGDNTLFDKKTIVQTFVTLIVHTTVAAKVCGCVGERFIIARYYNNNMESFMTNLHRLPLQAFKHRRRQRMLYNKTAMGVCKLNTGNGCKPL